jgi:hypothetical protein
LKERFMGLPYDTIPLGGIEIGSAQYGTINPDGTTTPWPGHAVVPLGVPSRITIVKVVVEQTDNSGGSIDGGGGDSFTVDLFNQRGAADDQVQLDANDNPLGRDLFRIMPTITGAAGRARFDSANSPGGCGFPFFNQDTNQQTPVTGVTDRLQQNQRVLYVVLTGTNGDVFSIVIGTDSDIHGI